MRLQITLFGPFGTRLDGTTLEIRSRRAQAILAMLALSPNGCVARDRLAATLWPDRSEAQAKASLRQELSNLRKSLESGRDLLTADATVVRLDMDAVALGLETQGRGEFLEGMDIRSEPFDDWRRGEALRLEKAQPATTGDALSVPDIFENPAVLLLGFTPASDESEDISFATGLVVDLRTSLGLWRWFPVIGPEAVGWKTEHDGDVRELAGSVGAAYVIGGMIRRSGEKVRVSASLTSANSGRLVWSDTFDGEISDIFALQEEISHAVVARVVPEIERSEAKRIVRRPPDSIHAWQLVARTEEIERTAGEGYGTPEANASMLPFLEEATRLEPDYARAWTRLGRQHFRAAMQGWTEDRTSAIDRAVELCAKAVALDPTEWESQAYRALTLIFGKHDFGPARFHAMEAVRLNPSATLARHACGCALEWIGEPEAALEHLYVIFDLDPNYTNRAAVLGDITTCELFVGNLEAAEVAARKIMNIAPDYARGLQRVVMTLGHTGDLETAERVLSRIYELMPEFDEAYVRQTYPYARPEDTEVIIEGLRRAGWTG
ncbi:hypothetical protein GQ651_12640 [Alphaproteobacteria bacterium GH1-50]|uniref:OmpR/PhoB-type domain-containing protein n=1 Tax=Kangsaoukella pontilimi TaxID=2691042 RepID=A0A7C9MH08_9RHOB|nr:winged helix-turn-helix domain-containing protein [Kangsaoukella pontilimi]MXQ08696.1 hypothetical protein [Kangsaoukella pontilimi]